MQLTEILKKELNFFDINHNKNYIPVNRPLLDGNELEYLNLCIKNGWISSEGPIIKLFEEKFAQAVNRKFAITVVNGSVALDAAMLALNLPKGSEVILPTFTIISCAAAIIRAGAIPVVVDSYQDTWNMNVEQIEAKITSKTKAIMIVHIYGLTVDIDPVLQLAKKYDLKVIEDAAQMHGQTYKNKQCGSFGQISTFSFYPNKHITTGEGGMIVTDDFELADRCRKLRNLCFKPERRFIHDELGFNFRMTSLQAALGLAQLEKLDKSVIKKREIGKFYTQALSDLNSVQLPKDKTDYCENIYWIYGLVLEDEVDFDADYIIKLLDKEGVGTRPFFWCMHEQPVFKKMGLFEYEDCPVAQNLARRGFYIPAGLGITLEEQEKVVTVLRKILK